MTLNAEPPLKSRNTNCSRSGGLRTAMARHQLCNSTDLPEPVVPATKACGPWRGRSIVNGRCPDPMPTVTHSDGEASHVLAMMRHGSGSA